jgi:lipopolysaccharide/colanic/teichoic acid biosynthesis glycosyltransferase
MSVASARAKRVIDPKGVQRLLKTADFVVLLIATVVVFLGSSLWIPAHAVSFVGVLALEVSLGSVLTMGWVGLYGLDVLLDLRRAVLSSVAATVVLGAIVFFSTHLGLFALEAWWLSVWMAVCVAHFTVTRTAAWLWARPRAAAGAFRQRVAVVGWGEDARQAVRLLEGTDPVRLEVVGAFDDRGSRGGAGASAMADLVEAAGAGLIDLVIVAIPFSNEDRLLQTLKALWPLPVEVRIARQAADLKLSPRAYGYLGKLALLSVFDRPLNGRRRAKGVLDRALAALMVVIVLPLLVVAALALRLEGRGAVLVTEQRRGFDGGAMAVYRFRDSGVIGATLSKLGLAGLPQLFNVLKGEMALVGPRLHSAATVPGDNLYQQVIDGYFVRHRVKPGITGWAQINGWPEDASVIEKTAKHDLEYVDRWSLLFDLYILFKAPFALLRKSPARPG